MKHIYTLLLGLLAWSASMAQEGVNFRDITFEEALKQAKSENKLVFMDCYTSWCGPCKNMADKVFPQKAAGDYFNPRFVCVKYDMEKGAGVELAKKFEVHAYPTFLMIRPDGSMQHRLVGGDGLEAFIARVEQGFDEQNNLSALHSRYEKGGLSKSELFRYWEVLEEAGEEIFWNGIASGFSGEQRVSPIWISGIPEIATISPMVAFCTSTLFKPSNT